MTPSRHRIISLIYLLVFLFKLFFVEADGDETIPPPLEEETGVQFPSKGKDDRSDRFVPIFNVISFDNNLCLGSGTRNGTCFTSFECSSRNGIPTGTCASGYGVCCVFVLGCGGVASTNCTYIEQPLISDVNGIGLNPCEYQICKFDTSVCRLRLDFITNILAPPVTGLNAATALSGVGGALGDCTTDTMVLSTPGGNASPVICGFNTGQHMIVDMSDLECNRLIFRIGSGSVSRQWFIMATQYVCNDDNGSGGPPGCLQYFRESSGTVASFNFDTGSATVDPTSTHLANQEYDICFRRGEGNCQICYAQQLTNSFGLSRSPSNDIAQSRANRNCTEDWITIPEGTAVTPANTPVIATAPSGINRFCGRLLAATDGQDTTATVCSIIIPFILGVNFNDFESTIGTTNANTNELAVVPGGTTGFFLAYKQNSCT